MATRTSIAGAQSSMQGAPEPIAALNRIRIREYESSWEAREPLVDIRTYCPHVIAPENICPFLRRRVADMLNVAQSALPEGLTFRIGTALRTVSMQKRGWDAYFERMRTEHPTWPLSALRRATNKYHAPYDQKAPPGHCTGGAVDVILVDLNNAPIDVTSPTVGWDAAYTWSDKLSAEAKSNRMLMVEAMLSAGYSNCRDEYWHYSWGDSAWAVRVGETECHYGWAHPPVCLEADFPGSSACDLRMNFERQYNGRIVRAEGSCAVPANAERTESGLPAWCVGLYWARDVPVTIVLTWQDAPANADLYSGPASDDLTVMDGVAQAGDSLLIHVTPPGDRLYLSNFPSTPKS